MWTCLDQQIRAQDELDMCKIRLQLKSPNTEEKTKKSRTEAILKQLSDIQNSKLETIHMLSEHEVCRKNSPVIIQLTCSILVGLSQSYTARRRKE